MPSEVRFDAENKKLYLDFECNNKDVELKYRRALLWRRSKHRHLASPCWRAPHRAYRRDEGWVDDTPPGPSIWSRLFGGGKEEK